MQVDLQVPWWLHFEACTSTTEFKRQVLYRHVLGVSSIRLSCFKLFATAKLRQPGGACSSTCDFDFSQCWGWWCMSQNALVRVSIFTQTACSLYWQMLSDSGRVFTAFSKTVCARMSLYNQAWPRQIRRGPGPGLHAPHVIFRKCFWTHHSQGKFNSCHLGASVLQALTDAHALRHGSFNRQCSVTWKGPFIVKVYCVIKRTENRVDHVDEPCICLCVYVTCAIVGCVFNQQNHSSPIISTKVKEAGALSWTKFHF